MELITELMQLKRELMIDEWEEIIQNVAGEDIMIENVKFVKT